MSTEDLVAFVHALRRRHLAVPPGVRGLHVPYARRGELAVPAFRMGPGGDPATDGRTASVRMMRNAAALPADLVFFDLEDASPDHPEYKSFARQYAVEALTTVDAGRRVLGFRPNGIRSEYFERDIVDVVDAAGDRLDVILIPKTEFADEVRDILRIVRRIQSRRRRTNRIVAEVLIESPRALLEAERIAALDDVAALIYGSFDLARGTGGTVDPHSWTSDHAMARQSLPLAAAAYGKDAVDAITATIPVRPARADTMTDEEYRSALESDPAALDPARYSPSFLKALFDRRTAIRLAASDAMSARRCGYAAKWILHPDQIAPVQAAWTPSRPEALRALSLVARYAGASASGSGTTAVDGVMTDKATAAAEWWAVVYGLRAEVLTGSDIAGTGFTVSELERMVLPQAPLR